MKTKKICLIGDFAVGKTSLVSRFVHSTFSDKYLSTLGVNIDTKRVALPNGAEVKLVIWDIAGKSAIASVDTAYLRDAAGYLLVVDGTRNDTLTSAIALQAEIEGVLGTRPFLTLLNKHDLQEQWRLSEDDLNLLDSRGWQWKHSSALTGAGVESAFTRLGEQLIGS